MNLLVSSIRFVSGWSGLLSIIWTLFILYATLSPSSGGASWLSLIPYGDKIAHFGVFAIWAGLFILYLSRSAQKGWSIILIIGIAGLFLASVTEIGQQYVPGREADIIDMVFDGIGLGLGSYITFMLKKMV